MKLLFDKLSYQSSKATTKLYSTSFSWSVALLPKQMRKDIYNIYGFVRVADEIVDSFHHYPQENLLKRFEDEFWHAYTCGISTNPIIHAFVQTLLKYRIDQNLVRAFLQSMKSDLHVSDYNDQSTIDQYIYGSAEVVGLMCLKVFLRGNHAEYKKLEPNARALGAAFQKINFLRDLKDDLHELNRSYFPEVSFDNLNNSQKDMIVKDIENDLRLAYQGIKALPTDSRSGVYMAYRYYLKLFNKLKKTDAVDISKKRIRVPNFIKVLVLIDSNLRLKLNVI